MTTITAVELRKNMAEIFRRVEAGEKFRVTYRGNKKLVLEAESPEQPKKNPMAGIERLVNTPRKPSQLDPNKSIKELYHEMLDADPKYHGGRP